MDRQRIAPESDPGGIPADQKSGARGLRAILESALLDIMYDTPGASINEVMINEDVIEKHGSALITYSKDPKVAESGG